MHHSRQIAFCMAGLAVACIGTLMLTARDCVGQVRGADNPLVRVGADAPDFNLPRLTITNDPNGKPIGVIREMDTIRLSSFRGKKPVCLIMSSYT
ncbi:MAG: hypothetical protein A2Y76_00540 [Planctomycetes bacterium RBG_13_60_9]|nr:MAG: hypothetical protein A2Y76_00540 [Planctomycetes bacterium RBG_13_60_9]